MIRIIARKHNGARAHTYTHAINKAGDVRNGGRATNLQISRNQREKKTCIQLAPGREQGRGAAQRRALGDHLAN